MYRLMSDTREIGTINKEGSYYYVDIPNSEDTIVPLFLKGKSVLTRQEFDEWLESRCIPPNRIDIRKQLEIMNIDGYYIGQILDKTKAALVEDPFWLKTSPEDDWYKDTPRGRAAAMGIKL